jgi:hypothetical protein
MNIDLQNQGYSNMFPMFKGYTFLHAKWTLFYRIKVTSGSFQC